MADRRTAGDVTKTAPTSRPIVIRAQRDTVKLVVSAVAATFIMSYAIHARPDRAEHTSAESRDIATGGTLQQGWAGGLAEIAPSSELASDPITSASMVVPKSDLALPTTPVRPLVKLRGCEDSNCVARASGPTPTRRIATVAEPGRSARRANKKDDGSLMASLNPFKHLPDIAIVRRPLAYAGNTFTSWFRRD